jgi:hypothetical protein
MLMALAALVSHSTAWDAERDYSAAAQLRGQWTAFRETAAPDALMFVPEPVNATEWLRGRANPRQAVMWWPARSWVSCDGKLAVNFGPWLRNGGTRAGTFTTVWTRREDGRWQWKLDRGSRLPKPLPASDRRRIARSSCLNIQTARDAGVTDVQDSDILIQMGDGAPAAAAHIPSAPVDGELLQSGQSGDATLRWEVRHIKGAANGEHVLKVWRWDGHRHVLALYETTHEG